MGRYDAAPLKSVGPEARGWGGARPCIVPVGGATMFGFRPPPHPPATALADWAGGLTGAWAFGGEVAHFALRMDGRGRIHRKGGGTSSLRGSYQGFEHLGISLRRRRIADGMSDVARLARCADGGRSTYLPACHAPSGAVWRRPTGPRVASRVPYWRSRRNRASSGRVGVADACRGALSIGACGAAKDGRYNMQRTSDATSTR